jgi:hypothetical protein
MIVLGWSVGKNKVGDETGVWHLIVDDDPGHPSVAKPSCQGPRKKILVSGQVEKNPDGNLCPRCLLIATRLHVQLTVRRYEDFRGDRFVAEGKNDKG